MILTDGTRIKIGGLEILENVEDASSLVKLMEHTYTCNNNAIRISSVYHLMAEIYNVLTIVTLISKNVLVFIHFHRPYFLYSSFFPFFSKLLTWVGSLFQISSNFLRLFDVMIFHVRATVLVSNLYRSENIVCL